VEAFLVSTAVGALAEIGDKTQLLVIALAVSFRKPLPIILGIVAATALNHTAAAALGAWLAVMVSPRALRWIVCLSVSAILIWTLIPNKRPVQAQAYATPRIGVFVTTLWTFFLMEMGDKTQLATFALAAKYGSLLPVVAGTTLGILLVDVPVVILSAAAARRVPGKRLLRISQAMLLGLSGVALFQAVR
jgi:Ca2+/H+ antiporter, TMEM165/GDT1 family